MKQREKWNVFFAIEKNINYEPHMQDTKMLSQTALEASFRKCRPSLSFGRLLQKQLKFLAWKIWFLQGIVLSALCVLFFCLYTGDFMGWLSVTLPKFLCCCSAVIVLSAVPVLRRSSLYHMMELEQSTRFSISGCLEAQLLFIGIGDLGMLSVLIFTVVRFGLTGTVIFISLIVPFLTAAVTCLMLWSRTTSTVFVRATVLYCILTTILMNHIIDQYRQSHSDIRVTGWILYSLACLCILYREYRKIRVAGCFERMLP